MNLTYNFVRPGGMSELVIEKSQARLLEPRTQIRLSPINLRWIKVQSILIYEPRHQGVSASLFMSFVQ